MAETTKIKNQAGFAVETQRERWLKYGANVALTIVIVVLLAGFVVYLAQRKHVRKDTTAGGIYSLKPQTVQLVENLPQKMKIVGLFTKARHEEQEKKVDEEDNPAIRYQQVADLLQEYQQKSNGKVTVQMIDPIAEPGKLDDLFNEVAKKYGNDVNKYNEVVKDTYPKAVEEIDKITKQEIEALEKLPEIRDRDIGMTIRDVVNTVSGFPPLLQLINGEVKKQLELKVPDYKGAVDAIKDHLSGLKDNAQEIINSFKKLAASPKTPQPIKDYIAASEPRFEALKKAADGVLKKTEELGQLKQLDDLRQNKSGNTIAVMGESDMKVVPTASLFPPDDARGYDPTGGGKPRQRFAGEQQVTTALYTLTHPAKRKIAFIRSGGEPLTLRMGFSAGPLAMIADRLREVDFEILEKDVSGQWAMQAMQLQMQGIPLPPEPKDEELKDAVWVVFNTPVDPRAMMQNPSMGQLGAKVAEHLKAGGSAMILVSPNADNFSNVLKEWGIETRPDYVLVHEKIEPKGARSEDPVAAYAREQPFFLLKSYGDHPLTRPIQSLDGFFVPVVPVEVKPASGVKSAKLLAIPSNPKPWAERNISDVFEGKAVDFNPPKDGGDGDYDQGPFYGGAAAENDKGNRLVVLGCPRFAFNDIMRLRDPQNRQSFRFPGNGELFVNSAYWLAKMDTMIAISPTAFDVPRVAPLSDAALGFWRVGVLIVGLPLLVLAGGTLVYLKRRD
jgi:thiol-disulfide isomerase/thioredoxin